MKKLSVILLSIFLCAGFSAFVRADEAAVGAPTSVNSAAPTGQNSEASEQSTEKKKERKGKHGKKGRRHHRKTAATGA